MNEKDYKAIAKIMKVTHTDDTSHNLRCFKLADYFEKEELCSCEHSIEDHSHSDPFITHCWVEGCDCDDFYETFDKDEFLKWCGVEK